MGMSDGGSLIAGNKADLIVIDLQRAHLVPVLRVVSDYVHQGQGRDVEAVMVDGRWIMRAGEILTMDEERIVAEAQRLGKIAWRRLFERRPDLEVPPGFAPF
jgi:5-methylthioadenosine/S-adenosylhomocysteine deaminase